MVRQKRSPKKKSLPAGFDSKLEVDLHKEMTSCDWKPDKIPYVINKVYNPDAQYKDTIIEIKGRFRTSDEASKYLWVRDCMEGTGLSLVFVFANPRTPMPRARRRKDGSRRSVSDWADEHGFTWYDKKSLPDDWCN